MSEKDYDAPMHSLEHLLNGYISANITGSRAFSTHIEKKKSKIDFRFHRNLSPQEVESAIEYVNGAIAQGVEVSDEHISRQEAIEKYNLSRLPEEAGDNIRIVHIGSCDSCPCIGSHVGNSSDIGGTLRIISTDHNPETQTLRVRFKLIKG